jgi:hypothetical protein
VITRRDLYPGAQLAQSCHVCLLFSAEYPEIERIWRETSNYIAILAAKNEEELVKFCERLIKKGIRFSEFREPDFDNELTAIALEPGDKSRRATSSFPLALKNCKDGE